MIQKIKSSIGLKTFLSIASLLVICCVLIYTLILYFLPKTYQTELEGQFATDFQRIINKLETDGVENNSQMLVNFSIKNNAAIHITDGNEVEIFAINATVENDVADKSLSTSSEFQYDGNSYLVNATASFVAVAQSYDVLIKLLPLIATMIIMISVIGGYACSHGFSKPLVDICGVAKKMAQLDMTWKCNTSRNDEIGVLASRPMSQLQHIITILKMAISLKGVFQEQMTKRL